MRIELWIHIPGIGYLGLAGQQRPCQTDLAHYVQHVEYDQV